MENDLVSRCTATKVVGKKTIIKRQNMMSIGTSPWSTPEFPGDRWNRIPSTRMQIVRLPKKLGVYYTRAGGNPDAINFASTLLFQTQSRVLQMSSKLRYVSPWLSSAADQECERQEPADHRCYDEVAIHNNGHSVVPRSRGTCTVSLK